MEGESNQSTKKTPARLNVVYIKDFPFPSNARFTKENILSALAYSARDDDLIVSSYPKTGTTWVEYIMIQILYRGEKFPSMVELNHKVVPFVERVGAVAVEKLNSPRFIKFHMPFHLIPYNENAKYVYVVRNPKDVAVSYYHFRRPSEDDDSFDDFFEFFMSGNIPFGDYLEHVTSWLRHRGDKNLYFVCYEKLYKDTRNEILKLAKFLGEGHYKALKEDEELLSKILKITSFDYMNKNLFVPSATDANTGGSDVKTITFFRKGQPGDWKNHLSPEQSRRLDEKMREMLGEGELLDLWTSEIDVD